ncbi:MAG: hypothetical protein ACTHKU_03610, partial [Verrucomicrobiota bacterium]
MKTIRNCILIASVCLLSVAVCPAQTNAPDPAPDPAPESTSLLKDFIAGAASATNWTVAPYATYAPNAPTKLGGGVLAIYELNQYLGAAIGVDWLGQLYMPSGNVQLKLPLKVAGFQVTPFALGGIAIPLGGARSDNRNAAVIAGGGASATVYH